MACVNCRKKEQTGTGYYKRTALSFPPLNSTDVMVYDGQEVRILQEQDWPRDRHKLLLFYPETNTPVCKSEMGALNKWLPFFDEQGCDVYSITADPIEMVKDFYDNNEDLAGFQYKALSSLILPTRLNVMNGPRVKRASVFITKDGELLIQEHFMKVGRSLKELHRTLHAYNTDSYCGQGWEDPSDGFLNANN